MDRRRLLALPLATLAVGVADWAAACVVAVPPFTGIEQPADAIVAGAVAWTRSVGTPHPNNRDWRGMITVDGVARGRPEAKAYPLPSGGPCGPRFPRPEVGDLWVVYLIRDKRTGELIPRYAAPLVGARQRDPRLKSLKWRSRPIISPTLYCNNFCRV